eukprot:scaffold74742_cov29-Tisochrysis_lutea.AAC.3
MAWTASGNCLEEFAQCSGSSGSQNAMKPESSRQHRHRLAQLSAVSRTTRNADFPRMGYGEGRVGLPGSLGCSAPHAGPMLAVEMPPACFRGERYPPVDWTCPSEMIPR